MHLGTRLLRATVRACLLVATTAAVIVVPAVSVANVLGNPGFEIPATPAAPPEYLGPGCSWSGFGGAPFYDDAFLENLTVTPAKPTTWSKIKAMYR